MVSHTTQLVCYASSSFFSSLPASNIRAVPRIFSLCKLPKDGAIPLMRDPEPASASTGDEGPSDAGAVEDATCPPRIREHLLRPRLHEGSYDRSVFTVDAFASADEMEALVVAAHRLLDSYGTRGDAQPARSRLSIVSPVDKVLRLRLLALLEAELPDYADAAG